jgi:hypothetical protein
VVDLRSWVRAKRGPPVLAPMPVGGDGTLRVSSDTHTLDSIAQVDWFEPEPCVQLCVQTLKWMHGKSLRNKSAQKWPNSATHET